MTKYIWATDLAQFEVSETVLKNFKTFDTADEAFQDAVDHFRGIDDYKHYDITIYIAQLDYDDLTQQSYFNRILTDIETIAFQDYDDYDLEIVPSGTSDDPKTDIAAKYNNELKQLINRYLAEIGKKDDTIYPHVVNIQTKEYEGE